MEDLSAQAALLRTQDVRCDVLVAGANPYTLMVDPYTRGVARTIERSVRRPAAVNGERAPCDAARVVRAEIGDEPGYFVGLQ